MQSLNEATPDSNRLVALGLCASFNDSSGYSTFSIAVPRNREIKDYTIVALTPVELNKIQNH